MSVRDCGEASPYALLLFGGALDPNPIDGSILVDGWIKFAAHARVGALVAALRERLDGVLAAKAEDPALDVGASPVVAAILRLLLYDGLA